MMQLFWRGPILGQSGFELITRSLLIELDKLGVRIEVNNKYDWNLHKCKIDAEDVARLGRMLRQPVGEDAFVVSQQIPYRERRKAKGQACYTLFETDICPSPWLPELNKISETWVFSNFNRVSWTIGGVKNVRLLPFGMDSKLFNPSVEPVKIPNCKRFVFFANGDYTERKNFEGLIEAYVKRFSGDDDVTLLIKTHFGGFTKLHKQSCISRIKKSMYMFRKENMPHVVFFGDNVAQRDVPRFYTACDCFVLASRGEGLGLPYAEAMACGKPCIATDWGGQVDFVNDKNGYLVNSKLQLITDHEYIKKCINAVGHSWAHPDLNRLGDIMRHVYENPEEVKQKGEQARTDMEGRTWQKSALWVLNRIHELTK